MQMGIDVILGGGGDVFSFRYGNQSSPLETARSKGYQIVETRQQLLAASKTPLLGLFSNRSLPYRIDLPRNSSVPSLSEMAASALKLLIQADNMGKGVLLFVEGSEIDLAGHDNDAATQVRESWEYDDAFDTGL